jgi:hypothetical protein
MMDERGEKMQMVEAGQKTKYEITTDLFHSESITF